MRRGLFTFIVVVLSLYIGLHLVLGSTPVQRRVLEEIRKALAGYGLDLQIESIEFSALAPKIYLNRVTLKSRPKAVIALPTPLSIDKIKIEFQPLALIYRKIVIEEATLFHPVIAHNSIDKLVKKVSSLLAGVEKPARQKGDFGVVLKKAGVVDALLDVTSHEPALTVRTQSFTAFVQASSNEQQTVTVNTRNFEIVRGPLKTVIEKADFDVDLAPKSLRVNHAIVESEDLKLNVKGVSALPRKKEKYPSAVNASLDVKIGLKILNLVPELSLPALKGTVEVEGTASLAGGSYGGNGQIRYENIFVDGNHIGSGKLDFSLEDKFAKLTQVALHWAGGTLKSNEILVDLKDRPALSGELSLHDVTLEGILESVKAHDAPVQMGIDGPVKVSGYLQPLELNADLKNNISKLTVFDKPRPDGRRPEILSINHGTAQGRLTFQPGRMTFKAALGVLGGTADAEGVLAFADFAKISVKGHSLSLTELGHIADLTLGGTVDLNADIDVKGNDARIQGDFNAQGAEISRLVLGNVKGQAVYSNDLLAFENLETPSLEPITANGFVDFAPKKTHYKFEIDARRTEMARIQGCFQKTKLGFSLPEGGDLSARMTLEGGHDDGGIELKAQGSLKNFSWFGEKWLSSSFALTYRPAFVDMSRMALLKKSGGVEVHGHFTDKSSQLGFLSHGLKLEELDYLGKAPVTGEVAGNVELSLAPGKGIVSGKGEVKISKMTYRGNPLPDSSVKMRTADSGIELLGNLAGEGLKGRLVRKGDGRSGELLLYFMNFDFAPLLSIFAGHDLSSLTDCTATGDISIAGDLGNWRSLKGSGSIAQLNLGLKRTPMKNRQPIAIKMDAGALQIDRFHLVGPDSQISVELAFRPNESINGSLDGKLDLQFLQPFIPGLEYGSGPVSAGLRLSGRPEAYALIGNLSIEDGTFRLTGLSDEFRGVRAQFGLSQDRINIDRFDAKVNEGKLAIEGDVRINRFTSFVPNLKLSADRVGMKFKNYLSTRFSGDFTLRGEEAPYLLAGHCTIDEATLSSFDIPSAVKGPEGKPVIAFDVSCDAANTLFVKTDIMDADLNGHFHLLGNTSGVGLLGQAEVHSGTLVFRETQFQLGTGNVRFESSQKIAPRFTISGRAMVTAEKETNQPQYEVSLLVSGTPEDPRIHLTSQPALAENDIISLLLLGITSRNTEGNYMDLGSAVMGQIPFQSKLKNELGIDIKIKSRPQMTASGVTPAAPTIQTTGTDTTVPSVQIQKPITKSTNLSYSNTIETIPVREYKIEQILDENFTINATRTDNPHGSQTTQPNQSSYGVDIRYRFGFD